MMSANTFWEEFSYRQIVDRLIAVMTSKFQDFAPEQARFQEAVSSLPEAAAADALDAMNRQIGCVFLFSFFLGLKANADHFADSLAPTFLDADAEVYLQEDVATQLPDYQSGQAVLDAFYTRLSSSQYEDVLSYICYLETAGPKLAHYYGYLLGNRLFPRILPGYREDAQLTAAYQQMLESYFGISLS